MNENKLIDTRKDGVEFVRRTLANVAVLLADYEDFAKGVVTYSGGPCPDPERHTLIAAAVDQAAHVLRESADNRQGGVDGNPWAGPLLSHGTIAAKDIGARLITGEAVTAAFAETKAYRVTQRPVGAEHGTRSSFLTTSYGAAVQEFCRLAETAPMGVETVMYRNDAVVMKTAKG